MLLFALDASRYLGESVATALGVKLSPLEERTFADGEHKVRPLNSVHGQDACVLQSLHAGPDQSIGDKLFRLLVLIAALKDAGAAHVTAMTPYLCATRLDRRIQPFDPLALRTVAQMFEAVGTDAVIAVEPHNVAAFQNAFRIPAITLDARVPLVDLIVPHLEQEDMVVASPDVGGIKRAELFRNVLETRLGRTTGKAFVEKHRGEAGVSGGALVGEVHNRTVLLVDDMISTGSTLDQAVAACTQAKARRVLVTLTHGLFAPGSETVFNNPAVEAWFVTDTVQPFRLDASVCARLQVARIAPLLAEAIRTTLSHSPHGS